MLMLSAFRTNGIKSNFITGNPEIQSINALAFGPEGILFIGDSKSAAIYALDTKDAEKVAEAEKVEINQFDLQIAASLGTTPDKISIQDMAVNPVSKKVYVAVQAENGTPLLFCLENNEIKSFSLSNISYSKSMINNAVATDAKDKWGRSQRVWTISDMQYDDGKVLVSGLSNMEFGSTFRSISFPFTDQHDLATLEIYHAAHGQYETQAPIKTFTTSQIDGKKYLVASYTCTPLVLFPLNELKDGEHVKGRTVSEMGSGNSPLDMITMSKDGQKYLIMSNSNRPVMKVKYTDIEKYKESLNTPVEEMAATAGVPYINWPMVNVVQMDKLDDKQIVLLQRKSNGDLDLWTLSDRWL